MSGRDTGASHRGAEASSPSAPSASGHAPPTQALDVAPGVRIPPSELTLRAITGGGPGGQHVNRNATRIELRWSIRETRALSEEQRTRVAAKLASRLDADGELRIVAGEYRSQLQNRRAALERLSAMLARALVVPRVRKPTRPTQGAVERRLSDKRQQSERKQHRRFSSDD